MYYVMSIILLDFCTGLLAPKSEEAKAVKNLRQLRNEFVHELHLNPVLTQQVFEEKWQSIMKLLSPLAQFAGGSSQQVLESETQKILTQAIDAKKEREFADEFNVIYGQIDEVYSYTCTYVRPCPLKCSVGADILYCWTHLSMVAPWTPRCLCCGL